MRQLLTPGAGHHAIMDTSWMDEERRLWDALMSPRRRKITAHSVPRDSSQRAKVLTAIERQREREFTAGWQTFRTWIGHNPAATTIAGQRVLRDDAQRVEGRRRPGQGKNLRA